MIGLFSFETKNLLFFPKNKMTWTAKPFRNKTFIFTWITLAKRIIHDDERFSLDNPTLHKKWSFPLRISSVNVTKFAVSCGSGHIYCRNPSWKTLFFMQCEIIETYHPSHSKSSRYSEFLWRMRKIDSQFSFQIGPNHVHNGGNLRNPVPEIWPF